MLMKGITLRGLEVFEALAETGSVATASEITGLSQPAVSQQMRNLEKALGIDLLDHARRPMRLTPAGRAFRARTETVLGELRLAQSELTVMDLSDLTTLSIGLIDDFDNDLTPRLVTILAESMTNCRFRLITAPSHEINAAMRERSLHIAVAAHSGELVEGISEHPLVDDPFIIVAPRDVQCDPETVMAGLRARPLLRYDRSQLIARQIDAYLQRHQIDFPARFEVGSHLALMAMVARGIGWAVTTPLGYMRAARFHEDMTVYPLPFGSSSRRISLFAATDWADRVPRDVAQTMRRLVRTQMIDPALVRLPFLRGQLRVLE
ncbi:MAG: LysR family transcriptional regulator [Rhodobacteraceae bacterium]|nr:LysR family transcriptional regulator [Paracoccaceae bacterium]